MNLTLLALDSQCSVSLASDDVADWQPGHFEVLLQTGLLTNAGYSSSVTCDGCGESCLEDIIFTRHPVRAYVSCHLREDIGRVEIPLERLRSWNASADGLAAWLASELGASAQAEEIVPNRLWWLGGPDIDRRRADVFLARGASWPDASAVFSNAGRLRECTNALVLVPTELPVIHPLGVSSRIASLSRLLRLVKGSVFLDTREIETVIGKSRIKRIQDIVPFSVPPGTDWNQVVIEFVDDETVLVSAGGFKQPKTFEEMGFADRRRTGEPDKLWLLLRFLSLHEGRLGTDDNLSREEILRRKRQVTDLRKRLQFYFGISSDPFKPYKSERAYQTKFFITRAQRSR